MLKIEGDGVDGSGKSTAMKYFTEQARKLGLNVVETREVGNPNVPACLKLREFVLDPASDLDGKTMEFIFSAMRYENDRWFRKLAESENPPDLVVSDRGYASHLAYTDHNVSEEFTKALYQGVVEKDTLLPDIILYFSIDTETALKRRVKRGTGMDVIEMKGIEFQEKVRKSFEKYLAKMTNDGFDVFVIDANEDIEGVHRQLDEILGIILLHVKKA